MKKGDILRGSERGRDAAFEFQFDDTHLVRGRFIKLQDWGPFEKNGELTKKGIKFVESQTDKMGPMLWNEYIRNL